MKFVNAADAGLSDYDYPASYHADGHLTGVRPVQGIPASGDLAENLLPDLAERAAAVRRAPESYGTMLQCASCASTGVFGRRPGSSSLRRRTEPAATLRFSACRPNIAAGQPAAGVTKTELVAKPAHILQPDRSGLGVTELSWNAPAGVNTELHVGAPNGPLLRGGRKFRPCGDQKWVKDGMQFFLQDVTGGKSRTSENTLATVKVKFPPTAYPATTIRLPLPCLPPAPNSRPIRAYRSARSQRPRLHCADLESAGGYAVEIRICSPRGKLFTSGGSTGRAVTDKWVTNGMQFFLQDVTGGKPLTSENTSPLPESRSPHERNQTGIDAMSGSYEELLKNSFRDRFMAGAANFSCKKTRSDSRVSAGPSNRFTPAYMADIGCGKRELLTLLRSDSRRWPAATRRPEWRCRRTACGRRANARPERG